MAAIGKPKLFEEIMANPKDATIRNVKASNKRDDKLLALIKDLQRRVKALEKRK